MPGMDMDKTHAGTAPDRCAAMDMSAMGMGAMTMHGLLGGYAMSTRASGTSWQHGRGAPCRHPC